MLTKEFIKLLQEADPEGNTHCCVGNEDIFDVEVLPSYYDGSREELIRDEKKEPFYDVVGAKVIRNGYKIKISTLSIEGLVFDEPDFSVEYDEEDKHHKKRMDEYREKGRKFNQRQLNSYVIEILKKYKEGFRVVEPKKCTAHYFEQKWRNKKGKIIKGLCQGETQYLMESGFFKPVEKDDMTVWELDV